MPQLLLAHALVAALWLAAGAAHAVTCQNNIPPSNPNSVYTVHGDGTVTDIRTGLMWKQCLEGYGGTDCAPSGSSTSFAWAQALAHAESHTFAGHSDWRLPNLKELRSLVEECRHSPAINNAVFGLSNPSSKVWSGSPMAGSSASAWFVDFSNGSARDYKRSDLYYVRLVRDGQSLTLLPVLSAVALSGSPTATGATVAGTSNLAGTGYWVVVPQGSAAPTPAQVRAQAAYGGVTLAAHASASMALNVPQTFTVSNLAASTAYDFYLVVQSESNGPLSALRKVSFTTDAVPVVNGSCGTAHTTASATVPTSAVCSTGTATSVTGSNGAWSWGCEGSGGGSTATCSAPYASQILTLSANPVSLLVGSTSAITATSSAGLPVSLAGNAYCSVSGTSAKGTAVGTCTVTASQAGTGDVGVERYLAAPQKTVDITVNTITVPEGPQAGQHLVVTPPAQNNWVISSASTAPTSSIATPPPSTVELPHGIVSLKLAHGTAASNATVVLTYPQSLPAGTTYYKYGKTQDNPTDHWYPFSGAVISGNTITLTLTDGGAGDNDLAANGQIDDPGGPAVPKMLPTAQPIPTLSEWAMLVLTGLLGLMAVAVLRRGRSAAV